MRALPVLCFLLFAHPASPEDFDLLVRGGRIVDGTGNPSYLGDIAIRNGRIAAMGHLAGATAKRTMEASGLTVTPGFIDIHNHSDYTLVADGNAQSMIRQGVTSMILGEGGSAAPIGGKQEPRDRRVLLNEEPADWADFNGYFARLLREGISTNVGSYVGSSQIWTYVRGERAGPPTPEELGQMRALVRQAMEQGALGVASSLSGPPGSWIDTDTLVALCEAAAPYGGSYSTHMRTEGQGVFESVAEAIEIGRRAHVPVDMPELVATIARAPRASKCKPMCTPIAPGRTIWPPSFHPGRMRAARRR